MKISRNDFLKLDEKDVMFITNPGRMGDEDGSNFIVRYENEFTIYRVDGWMYPSKDEDRVSMEDAKKQFPEWTKAWEHATDENYEGKYKYLYMGFGNGLSIDKAIYAEYEPYLNKLVEEYLKGKEEKEELKYSAIYNVWMKAFKNMAEDKEYILK